MHTASIQPHSTQSGFPHNQKGGPPNSTAPTAAKQPVFSKLQTAPFCTLEPPEVFGPSAILEIDHMLTIGFP